LGQRDGCWYAAVAFTGVLKTLITDES